MATHPGIADTRLYPKLDTSKPEAKAVSLFEKLHHSIVDRLPGHPMFWVVTKHGWPEILTQNIITWVIARQVNTAGNKLPAPILHYAALGEGPFQCIGHY